MEETIQGRSCFRCFFNNSTGRGAGMELRKNTLALSLILVWIGRASVTLGADSVTIGFSSFSGFYGPLWIAVEDGLGRKYGLDLSAVYAGRIRPQQLLASGETPFVLATGTGAITSHIVGVKDQVIVLVLVNKVGGGIVSKPEIKSPEYLKGKVIGTGRPRALAETIVRYVLKAKLSLQPDRDVKLLPVGEPQLALQGLERGIVDAASFSMPAILVAKKKGFRELVSYEKLGIVYPYNTVT